MAPKISLAEKYAQNRRNTYSDVRDRPKVESPSFRNVYPRKTLSEKYESLRRGPETPAGSYSTGANYGSYGGTNYGNYASSYGTDYGNTYGTSGYSKYGTSIHGNTNYGASRSTTGAYGKELLSGKVTKPATKSNGLLGRVKNFLNNFGLEGFSDSTDYKTLKSSISAVTKELPPVAYTSPQTYSKSTAETVDYHKIFDLRDSKRTEVDEVTQSIERRKQREEEAKLENLKESMQQRLEAELLKRQEAEEAYERKLYLLKSDFEARIFSVEERMEAMKKEAEQHSKALRAQSTAELMEQKEAMYMNQIEASTNIRNLNTLIAEKEQDIEAMRAKLNELGRRNETSTKVSDGEGDNDQLIRSILNGNQTCSLKEETHEYDGEIRALQKKADENEMAVIHFYEALQASSDTDYGKLHVLGSRSLFKRVELLLQKLKTRAEPSETTSQLDDYEKYFDCCKAIKDKDPRHLLLLYKKETLDGMESYFKQVLELNRRKLVREKTKLRHLDLRLSNYLFKNLTLRKADQIALDLESRTRLLAQHRQTLAVLVRLEQMVPKISTVREALQ